MKLFGSDKEDSPGGRPKIYIDFIFGWLAFRQVRNLLESFTIVIIGLLAILAGLIIAWPDCAEPPLRSFDEAGNWSGITNIAAWPIPDQVRETAAADKVPKRVYYFGETFCSKTLDFGDSISVLLFLPDRPPTEIRYYEYPNPVIDWMQLAQK